MKTKTLALLMALLGILIVSCTEEEDLPSDPCATLELPYQSFAEESATFDVYRGVNRLVFVDEMGEERRYDLVRYEKFSQDYDVSRSCCDREKRMRYPGDRIIAQFKGADSITIEFDHTIQLLEEETPAAAENLVDVLTLSVYFQFASTRAGYAFSQLITSNRGGAEPNQQRAPEPTYTVKEKTFEEVYFPWQNPIFILYPLHFNKTQGILDFRILSYEEGLRHWILDRLE